MPRLKEGDKVWFNWQDGVMGVPVHSISNIDGKMKIIVKPFGQHLVLEPSEISTIPDGKIKGARTFGWSDDCC